MFFFYKGYFGDGHSCTNVNECDVQEGESEARHNCDSSANCTDTEGSFSCQCVDGYSGDGVTCRGNIPSLNF